MSHIYSKIYQATRENAIPYGSPHEMIAQLFLSASRQMAHALEAIHSKEIEALAQRTDRVIYILSGIISNLEVDTAEKQEAALKLKVMLDSFIDLVVRFTVHQDLSLGQQLITNFKDIAEAWQASAPAPEATILASELEQTA